MNTRGAWFGKTSTVVAAAALILAGLVPVEGVGVPLCWVSACFEIPCPGCGLTRALACAMRGRFADSLQHHPFGLPLLFLFAATIAFAVLPIRVQDRAHAWIAAHERWSRVAYVSLTASFVAFGAIRAAFAIAAKL